VFFSSATVAGAFSENSIPGRIHHQGAERCIRWLARRGNPQYGRHRQEAWLGLDLHPRRAVYRYLCCRVFLYSTRLPRYRQVPYGDRTQVCSVLHSADLLKLSFLGVWVIRRLQSDMKFSAGGEKFKMKYVRQSLRDWKTWIASTCAPRQHGVTTLISAQWVYTWDCKASQIVVVENTAEYLGIAMVRCSVFRCSCLLLSAR
jgi:hypothetical protein